MRKIERAIISVTDKSGVVDFGNPLDKFGIQILSTGGTAKALSEAGVPVMDVSEYTGFPEMMDGSVKTLHPKVHGGHPRHDRDNPEHVETMKTHGIKHIDMVVVNLYPFEKTMEKPDDPARGDRKHRHRRPDDDKDVAKNYRDVTVVTDPADYGPVLKEMEEWKGSTSLKTRFRLAKKGLPDDPRIRRGHHEVPGENGLSSRLP